MGMTECFCFSHNKPHDVRGRAYEFVPTVVVAGSNHTISELVLATTAQVHAYFWTVTSVHRLLALSTGSAFTS